MPTGQPIFLAIWKAECLQLSVVVLVFRRIFELKMVADSAIDPQAFPLLIAKRFSRGI